MAENVKEKKNKNEACCSGGCNCFDILSGFKFGFGIYLAFLTGTLILSLLTVIIWWILKAF